MAAGYLDGLAEPRSSLTALRDHMYPPGQRRPGGIMGVVVSAGSVGLIGLTLYMGIFGTFGQIGTNALHLAIAIPLVFLLYPARKGAEHTVTPPSLPDIALAGAALAAFGWAYVSQERFSDRMIYIDAVEWYDFAFGMAAILVTLEATRRALDMIIVWLTLLFGAYALTGPIWPGLFEHRGMSLEALVEYLYLVPEGLFSSLMTIAATFLFTFLLFGAMLQASGGERTFMNLAMAAAGHRRGGPAKVAVIGSALMGTLSGSTVSNVVMTGSITIPLMKRLGYKPEEAGAIETVAGVGGALMPPVMGAGVFLMAAFTGVPLITILQYSVAPAILYYAALYFYVDIKARKHNIVGLPADQLPRLSSSFARALPLFVPIAVLVGLMVWGFTPFYASSVCVIALYAIAQLRRETRVSFRQLLIALESATRSGLNISTLSASSAMVFGVMITTALVVKSTSIFLSLAGGSIFLLIILIGVAAYIVGLAMPVTATYVIVSALGAGALGELGVPILAAHLIIFWHSQNATISPPIALTAQIAATIAKASPLKTANQAVLMANAIFVVPFIFAYGSLLSPNWFEVIFDFVALLGFFFCGTVVYEGHWTRRLDWLERGLFALAGVLLIVATLGPMAQGWPFLIGGGAAFLIATALQRRPVAAAT
jgi:TRAP transporter 4TM/12TM fusion protein